MALYVQADEPPPPEEIINEVFARHAQALEGNQMNPLSDFERWHSSGHSNLPKSLANRTTDACGKLAPAVVQRALL